MGKLTDVAIRAARSGRLQDGDGLMLLVKPSGSKFWVVRVMRDGKRKDIGIGGYPAVSLALARAKAQALRAEVKAGTDVVAKRRQERAGRLEAANRTFERVARLLHEKLTFKTEKQRAAWLYRLETYAFPYFGHVPIADLGGPHVLEALEPIWLAKPETARRVRQLVGAVLRFAHVQGWRGPIPALADYTKDGLPKQASGPVHRPAVEYADAPAVVAKLMAGTRTMGRQALIFTILTAARSSETRLATWGEIDLEAATWTIPGSRMKMGREHVVPLSPQAVALLKSRLAERAFMKLEAPEAGEIVFASDRGGVPISDMTMLKAQKLVAPGTVPHGWRSTFRDWAGETTDHPADVCEAALAHRIGNAVTRSYQRGNLLAKRRALMNDWANYVMPGAQETVAPAEAGGADVVALDSRRSRAG
jgi:integrase